MVTKELLKAEIDNVPEEQLEKLYRVMRSLEQAKPKISSGESFMTKLQRISIEGPVDFSGNFDAYLNWGKEF